MQFTMNAEYLNETYCNNLQLADILNLCSVGQIDLVIVRTNEPLIGFGVNKTVKMPLTARIVKFNQKEKYKLEGVLSVQIFHRAFNQIIFNKNFAGMQGKKQTKQQERRKRQMDWEFFRMKNVFGIQNSRQT